MKKALLISNVISMIYKFNLSNIKILQELGYEVHAACNLTNTSFSPKENNERWMAELQEIGVIFHQVDFGRRYAAYTTIGKCIKQIRSILDADEFMFVHCHSQIAGVCGRLAVKGRDVKTIYTAHGFMFFKGSPLLNWILFYPQEWLLSWGTDLLITINKEDYGRAKKHFHAKKTVYVPGVGVDIQKFSSHKILMEDKRKELGIPDDAFVLLSVGELSDRKNQQVVIRALGEIGDKSIFYVIAGYGNKYDEYKRIENEVGVSNQVKLLGCRNDIDELCDMADVFVHPSVREGLGIAPLEAMAAGLPLISSYINGMKDYTVDGETGICLKDPMSIEEMKNAILKMKGDEEFRKICSSNNIKIAKEYDVTNSDAIMRENYGGGNLNHLTRIIERSRIRKELSVSKGEILFISIGELSKRKNHEVLIHAFSNIKTINWKLCICGTGELEDYLSDKIKKYNLADKVKLLGYRDDIDKLLLAADVFVFPSLQEGLPVSVMEAMASRLPCLVSRIRGNTDLIDESKGGELFAPKNIDEIEIAIEKIINTDCEEMGRYNAIKI
ncbi:MAG: glycosyltransferase [Clostridiales bacterium]|nr:glycosyltransferase [Clostridiales bacterium]